MTKRLLAVIISLICLIGVFASSLNVCAATIIPRATEESGTTERTTEDSEDNYVDLKPTTKPSTSPSTTKKPTTTERTTAEETKEETTRKQTPTKKPVNNNNDDDETPATTRRDNAKVTEETTSTTASSETFVEETLPGGSFYVYVEKNNGEPRLKRVMSAKGIVPQPTDPVRVGYIFKGWYADPEFKRAWNFYSDEADIGTVIYARWEPDAGNQEYKITVKSVEGGKLQVNPSSASEGEYVVISVMPDDGKRLVVGSVTVNGVPTDVLSFLMPDENVVIEAKFEDTPETVVDEEENNILPFIIAGVVLAAAIIAVIIITSILRRRNEISEEDIDENGTIIDNDDGDWIDETLVVEDGFKEGERVVGNFTPEDESEDFFAENEE